MSTTLSDQLAEARGFESFEQQAFLSIVFTADGLMLELGRLLKAHGLSPALYNVLRILRGAEPEGLRCGEVADRLLNRVPDVTRLLDRLDRAGLVSRRRQDEDRRIVRVRVTEGALDLLGQLDAPVRELHVAQLGHLNPRDRRDLLRLLRKARDRREADA
jgi:DNA-binding MarR family transcriptional regulator